MHQHSTLYRRLATLYATLTLLIGALITGCGQSSDLEKVVVTGRITLDGQPIPNGEIRFIPDQGTKGPISGGPIKDGAYKADGRGGVPVGAHVVEIRGYRPQGGPRSAAAEGGPAEQFVPAKYNDRTTLKATIDADTTMQDFELSSK